MTRGTKKFFDTESQRGWVFQTCLRNGLDNANPEIRWSLREYHRLKHGFYDPGTEWFLRKYGWSGIGSPPEWFASGKKPPPDVVLDPTAEDPPTLDQISKYREINPSVGGGADPFWDNVTQCDRLYRYVHDHHPTEYDFNNPKDKFNLREADRAKNGFYNKGGKGYGLPKGLSPNDLSVARRLRDLQIVVIGKAKTGTMTKDPAQLARLAASTQNPLLAAMPRGNHVKSQLPRLRKNPNFGPAAAVDNLKQHFGRMQNVQDKPPTPPVVSPTDKPLMKDLVPWGSIEGEDGTYASWYETFINPEFAKPWRKEDPLGKIHFQWGEDLESDDFVIHLDPRGHLKTSFFSIGYIVFCLCERLYYPALIICLSDKNVVNIWGAIKRHLTENPRILERYGYIIDDERPNSTDIGFFVQYQERGIKDPACFCTTWNAKEVMGTHPKIVVCDDIQDRPLPPSQMETAVQLLDANLLPAIGIDGKMIIVGTIKGRSSEDDIYLYLIAKDMYSAFEYPAIYEVDKKGQPVCEGIDYNGKPKRRAICPDMKDVEYDRVYVPRVDPRNGKPVLNKTTGKPKLKREIVITSIKDRWKYQSIYPEVWTVERIIIERIRLNDPRMHGVGDGRFWSEYFLRPYNPTGVYFPRERIGAIGGKECPFKSVGGIVETLVKNNSGTYLSVDPGGKGKHGITIAVFAPLDGNFYILQAVVIKAGILAAAKEIARLLITYHVIAWGIEGNFLQAETFGEPLDTAVNAALKEENYPLYISPIVFKTTGDKILRISEQIGSVIGPAGSGSLKFFVNQESTDYVQFDDEVTRFPTVQSQTSITHEYDILDAVACGKVYVLPANFTLVWDAGYASNPLSPTQEDSFF